MRSVFLLSLLSLVNAQLWVRNYTVNPLAQYFANCDASGLAFPLTPPITYTGTLKTPPTSPVGSSVAADLTIVTVDGCHGNLSAVALGVLYVNWSFVIVNGSYLYVWDLSCDDRSGNGFCNTFSCFLGPRPTDFGPGLYHIEYDTLTDGTGRPDCNRFNLTIVADPCNRALNSSSFEPQPSRQCYAPTPSPTPTPAAPAPSPTVAASSVAQGSTATPAPGGSTQSPVVGTTRTSSAGQSTGGATAGANCTSGGDCLSGSCQNQQCVSSAGSLSLLVAVLVTLL